MTPRLFSALTLTLAALVAPLPAQTSPVPPDDAVARVLAEETRDPLERVNRGSFWLNHRVILGLIEIPARGYRRITPNFLREGIDNFATNLTGPRRILNNLFQGSWRRAGTESKRFLANTTIGLLGLFDPATDWWEIPFHDEDFGQSLGRHGLPPGAPLEAPLLGPSNPRDLLAGVVDWLMNPLSYVPGAGLVVRFNGFSMRLAEYDSALRSVDDPYVAFRDLSTLSREGAVRDFAAAPPPPPSVEVPPPPFAGADRAVADSATRLDHFPDLDRHSSSLLAFLFEPEDINFFLRARERNVPMTATGRELPVRLWRNGTGSPVVFILPGLGAHPAAGGVVALAELHFNEGCTVVALPSTFHAEFSRNASSVPLPGHVEIDARDTHQAMLDVLDWLHTRYDYPPDVPALVVGQSYGGLHALVISELDRRAGHPRFTGFLALNPSINMEHGVETLDRLFEAEYLPADPGGEDPRIASLLRASQLFRRPRQMGEAPPAVRADDAMFGIGVYFRMRLRDALFETQRRQDLGVLRTPASGWRREPRYEEIMAIGFGDYAREFLTPHFGEPSVESLFARGDLRRLQSGLAGNDRVRVIHTADDFLLGPGDLAFLRETLGDRLTLFDRGGHCGNYHMPQVQRAFREQARALLDLAPPGAGLSPAVAARR